LEDLQEEQLSESVVEGLQQDTLLLNAQHPALGTALHVAVQNGAPRVVEILLELGVDSTVKNEKGLSPVEVFKGAYASVEARNENLAHEFSLYIEEVSQLCAEW
jgi:ankyrin repeat protein